MKSFYNMKLDSNDWGVCGQVEKTKVGPGVSFKLSVVGFLFRPTYFDWEEKLLDLCKKMSEVLLFQGSWLTVVDFTCPPTLVVVL